MKKLNDDIAFWHWARARQAKSGVSRSSYWTKQLSRNTDEVLCSGYYTVDTAGTNLNLTTSDGAVTLFCQRNNLGVIRQTGLVTKVKFYAVVDPTKALESFLIMFFRKDGDNYDRIGYEDVVSQVTATGVQTVTLTTPISVQLGDYVVIGGNRGTSATSTVKCKTGYTAGNRYADFVWYPTSPNQNYAWDSATQGNWIIPVQCYMQAPLVAIIGDSLTAGHGTGPGGSFIENTNYPATTKLIGYSLYAGNSKYICQDMGIGAQATTAIAARFAADVVALKPKIAIIEGGVNDIALGTVSKATFIANMTAMLNACLTNDILPVVCKILPWTNGTEGQMQTRDEWMTDLKALVESATYNGAVWVDFDTAIGKNRVGGDEGNLWDIQTDPDYDDDGVHLTLLGYQKMAEVINAAIVAKGYVLV